MKSYIFKRYFLCIGATLLGLLFSIVDVHAQGCGINSDITIESRSSADIVLEVSGLSSSDLASDQSLCGVRLVFNHNRIANIRITLISPAGQEVVLLGPGRLNSGETPFINWNILFNNCITANNPDSGFSETWDNDQAWASFNNYTGTYDPFGGCLDDFDSGSANGTWRLQIENLGDADFNLQYFELIFCDNSGIECEECISFPGDYTFSSPGGVVSSCAGEAVEATQLEVDLPPVVQPGQLHEYIYALNGDIIMIDQSANNLEGLPPGLYTICSLVYDSDDFNVVQSTSSINELENLIETNAICAALSANCITLRLLEVINRLTIDTVFCSADTIEYRGFLFTENIDTLFVIEDFNAETCDTVIEFSARQNHISISIDGLSSELVCGENIFLNALGSSATELGIDNYSWSSLDGSLGNTQGPITEINSEGNYTLTVRSGFCVDSLDFEITAFNTFDWELQLIPPACSMDSFFLELNSGSGIPELQFSGPGEVNSVSETSFSVYDEGIYQVQAVLGNCMDSMSINVQGRPDQIEVQILLDTITCSEPSANLELITDSKLLSLDIIGPEIFSTDQLLFEVATAGEYMLSVNDDMGCMASFNFEVTEQTDSPQITLDDILIDCNETVPFFEPVVSGLYDSVSWTGPRNYESEDLFALPVREGEYSLTVFARNGCDTTLTAEFSTENIPVQLQTTSSNLDCIQREVELCITSTGLYDSIVWQQSGIVLTNDSCYVTNVEGSFTVISYDSYCFSTETIIVEDFSEAIDFDLILTDSVISCTNKDIIAELVFQNMQYSYETLWFLEGELIQNAQAMLQITSAGNYMVSIFNTNNGCSEVSEFSIIEVGNSFESTQLDVDNALCFPDPGSIRLSGLPFNTPFGMTLNGEVVDLRELPEIILEPGNYSLVLSDANDCLFESEFVIEEGREIFVDLGEDISGTEMDMIRLEAETNIPIEEVDAINWTSQNTIACELCLQTDYQLVENEFVIVELVDIFGCTAIDSIELRVKEFQEYYIPNIFSPNGDGNNDDFEIYLSDAINKVFDLRIFDRWGNLVLFRPEISEDNSNFVWDGFYNGKKAEEGVYVYVAKLLRIDGSELLIRGELILIR